MPSKVTEARIATAVTVGAAHALLGYRDGASPRRALCELERVGQQRQVWVEGTR